MSWSVLFFGGALFLGWSLGRNGLSNMFGAAIGTRMISFLTAVAVASAFVLLGAIISGAGTTGNVTQMAPIRTMLDAFVITVSAGCVLVALGRLGVTVSIIQASVGALVGWDLFYGADVPVDLILKTIAAWVAAPFLGGAMSWFMYKGVKRYLKARPIPLLQRDMLIRMALIAGGAFCSYALGANNISSIIGPFSAVGTFNTGVLAGLAALAVSVGFYMADKRVIFTVSRGLFPLSPMEAFISVFSGAFILILFSSTALRDFLHFLHLPALPLVPVPLSCVTIGAIIGISLVKGGYGLNMMTVRRILLSWGLAPVVSGLICCVLLTIIHVIGVGHVN